MSNISQFFPGYANYPFPNNISNDPILVDILLVGGGGNGGINNGTSTSASGGGGGGEVIDIRQLILRRGLTFNFVIGSGQPSTITPQPGGDSILTLVPPGGTLQDGLGSIVAKGGACGASDRTSLTSAVAGGCGGGGGSRLGQRNNSLYPWGSSPFRKNEFSSYIKLETDVLKYSRFANKGGNGVRQNAQLSNVYAGGGGGGAGGPGGDGTQQGTLYLGGNGGRSYRYSLIPRFFPTSQPDLEYVVGGGGIGSIPSGTLPTGSRAGFFDYAAPTLASGWGGLARTRQQFESGISNESAPGVIFISTDNDIPGLTSTSGLFQATEARPGFNVYYSFTSGSFTV